MVFHRTQSICFEKDIEIIQSKNVGRAEERWEGGEGGESLISDHL